MNDVSYLYSYITLTVTDVLTFVVINLLTNNKNDFMNFIKIARLFSVIVLVAVCLPVYSQTEAPSKFDMKKDGDGDGEDNKNWFYDNIRYRNKCRYQ